MDRADAAGIGVALVGHAAVLALLLVGLANLTHTPPPPTDAIEVSFAEDVAAVSAGPATEAPAQSVAPDLGPLEDAAPAAEPTPAPPRIEPTPPPPAPVPTPQPRAEPAPPQRRAERPAPQPKPERPAVVRPTPARPAPARPAQPRASQGASGNAQAERPRGARIGRDLLKGLSDEPSTSRETRPRGATMSQAAAADIGSAIRRQVQPCADRQVVPAGAEQIVTEIILRLNPDGTLAARPRVGAQTGLNDENGRYADRAADLAIRAFVECSPLRGLPAELYDVPNGWRSFRLRYRLPG